MAENHTLEGYEWDLIEKRAGRETRDAKYGIWRALDLEMRTRRRGVQLAVSRVVWGRKIHAPAANQDNLKHDDVVWQRFDGASSVNVTGWRAGIEGQLIIVDVLGTGTITLVHNSGASEAANRILTQTAGNIAVATNRALMLAYLNTRWRHVSLL